MFLPFLAIALHNSTLSDLLYILLNLFSHSSPQGSFNILDHVTVFTLPEIQE